MLWRGGRLGRRVLGCMHCMPGRLQMLLSGWRRRKLPHNLADYQFTLSLDPAQEAHAARWVRRVDPVTGRSYGVGKRKTSVALVWLKEGKGEPPAGAWHYFHPAALAVAWPTD